MKPESICDELRHELQSLQITSAAYRRNAIYKIMQKYINTADLSDVSESDDEEEEMLDTVKELLVRCFKGLIFFLFYIKVCSNYYCCCICHGGVYLNFLV